VPTHITSRVDGKILADITILDLQFVKTWGGDCVREALTLARQAHLFFLPVNSPQRSASRATTTSANGRASFSPSSSSTLTSPTQLGETVVKVAGQTAHLVPDYEVLNQK